MSGQVTPLAQLRASRQEILSADRPPAAHLLDHAVQQAARQPDPGGDDRELDRLAASWTTAAHHVDGALYVLDRLRQTALPAAWAGDTQVAAATVLQATANDLNRALRTVEAVAARLRKLAHAIEPCRREDAAGLADLESARELTDELLDSRISDPTSEDPATSTRQPDQTELMGRAHERALQGVDARIHAHHAVMVASTEAARDWNDRATQARLHRMADSPLSALDELVLIDARSRRDDIDTAILTALQADRAAHLLNALPPAEQEQIKLLLAGAGSADHRAYLMRALAAGYDVGEITRFHQMIAPYGADPEWLRQHLNPMDTSRQETGQFMNLTAFDGQASWTQGNHPTCVASSTVIARAAVDPLYALELTTGNHPGDPAHDNPRAFADRLLAEQYRVYDGGRNWFDTGDGMTNEQSATVATDELAPATGVHYENHTVTGEAEWRRTLPDIERAVDEGYVVPFSSDDADSGHQMLIIGHEGGRLLVHNPWGYNVWVSEWDFVRGDLHFDSVPKTPTSVRLPSH